MYSITTVVTEMQPCIAVLTEILQGSHRKRKRGYCCKQWQLLTKASYDFFASCVSNYTEEKNKKGQAEFYKVIK